MPIRWAGQYASQSARLLRHSLVGGTRSASLGRLVQETGAFSRAYCHRRQIKLDSGLFNDLFSAMPETLIRSHYEVRNDFASRSIAVKKCIFAFYRGMWIRDEYISWDKFLVKSMKKCQKFFSLNSNAMNKISQYEWRCISYPV